MYDKLKKNNIVQMGCLGHNLGKSQIDYQTMFVQADKKV